MDAARPKQLTVAECAYDMLTGYGFARRYIGGKSVADIGWEELGCGTRLLAETAESVVGLVGSPEAAERASTVSPAPNVGYQSVLLPDLPYPEKSFDVVVAFQVIEKLDRPENLMKEAKRILKRDGVLLISTPDKQAHSNERNHRNPAHKKEMYVPEFRELLGRYFEQVRMYRQGAVAGGLIFESPEGLSSTPVESFPFYSANLSFGVEPPATHFVIAVCGGPEAPEQENPQPYLFLDRDGRIFDERDDYREDVELLRDEIQHMQETEVQAFHEALATRNGEIRRLRARERELTNRIRGLEGRLRKQKDQERKLKGLEAQVRNLKTHIQNIEGSRAWRLLTFYRRLRGADDSERTG
jgi:SAM-dependent methyltransferase